MCFTLFSSAFGGSALSSTPFMFPPPTFCDVAEVEIIHNMNKINMATNKK
jgi:hypothetical protein